MTTTIGRSNKGQIDTDINMRKRDSLDSYDIRPEGMTNYLRYNGLHFNHKMCDFAVKNMTKSGVNGKEEKLNPLSKEQVDVILAKYNVTLKNNQLYDYVYIANMVKADFYGSSIEDDKHLALYVKDVIEDIDGPDGFIFNRWYADMCRAGISIDWEEMI